MNRLTAKLYDMFDSNVFFYVAVTLFALGAGWIALASIYPMAFDEEFHYGLIKIYATSLLPYGIEHTSDMAQFGSATADASYLFHYLMSFPYRILDLLGLSDVTVLIVLRFVNIAFVLGALFVFRMALIEAGLSRATSHVSLLLVTLIPIFPLLAAHINYDNLLLLVFAWCVLCVVRMTNLVRSGKPLPLGQSVQLAVAVLIGMSIKYAFLPLALGLFIWMVWLLIKGYRLHRQTVSTQLKSMQKTWKSYTRSRRLAMAGLIVIAFFFASHYVTNTLTYGSPIPSCELVFSETECTAYGPWNRNKNMEARKSESFQPMSYPAYMTSEWVPGMTQRLLFAVAGKTNDFQTKLPLPILTNIFVVLSAFGLCCLIYQALLRRRSWFAGFTILLSLLYAAVLSFQLYGDYVDTAEPVAINGRYLLPLLPLVAATLIQAIRYAGRTLHRGIIPAATAILLLLLIPAGAGIGTYVIQSESHWFWPGTGRESHALLQSAYERLVFPVRY